MREGVCSYSWRFYVSASQGRKVNIPGWRLGIVRISAVSAIRTFFLIFTITLAFIFPFEHFANNTINIINIGYIKPDIQAKAYIERVLLPSITNEAGAPKLAIGLLAASAVLPDTQKSLHLSRFFFPDRFSDFFAVSHPSNRKFREIFHLSC